MHMKCSKPHFFYEYKQKRTVMLKDEEPPKKEHYHVIYLRK